MRRLVVVCISLLFIEYINAQVVENPVFDRTDVFMFHVKKVEITKDTTFVYCSYSAEDHSWANISDKTYLENMQDGKKYSIIKVSGIPFGPDKRHFTYEEEIQVVLYFPHVSADKINIIESEDEEAFNIYGIDLTHSYNSSYTSEDIDNYFESYQKKKEEEDWHSALEFTQKQLEATNYVEGIRSFASACSIYNVMFAFFGLKDYEKMAEWGKKAIDILRELPQDSVCLDVLARAYGNVGTAYHLLKEHSVADEYMELSLATRRLKDGVGVLNYEEYLGEMAKNYYYEENYPKALLYGKEVTEIYKKKYEEKNYKYGCVYVNSLSNCCEFCQRMDKFEEAIDYGKQALSLIENGACQDSVSSSWLKRAIYVNLAGAMSTLGQVDDALQYLEYVITTVPLKWTNRSLKSLK